MNSVESFRERIAGENRRPAIIVSSVLTGWVVLSLVFDYIYFVPVGETYYLYADLAITPFTLGILLINLTSRASNLVKDRATTAYVVVIVVWAGALTAFQGTAYTFLIIAFILGATHLTSMGMTVVIYSGGLVSFAATMIALYGTPFHHGVALAMEILAMLVSAAIVSRILYRARTDRFVAEESLQALAAKQRKQIANRTKQLRSINATLKQRVKEREVLLREIHHRVKNNLQILASLLHLSEAHPPRGGAKGLLKSTESRILSMALVHQRLYDNDGLESVDLSSYLAELSGYVVGSHQQRHQPVIKKALRSCDVSVDMALNLGLIATEALSNAIAHAFPDDQSECRVEIGCSQENGEIRLWVRDNGRGFPEGAPKGTKTNRKRHGLGLLLIESLTEQLGGTLSVENDGGTSLTCSIPVAGQSATE